MKILLAVVVGLLMSFVFLGIQLTEQTAHPGQEMVQLESSIEILANLREEIRGTEAQRRKEKERAGNSVIISSPTRAGRGGRRDEVSSPKLERRALKPEQVTYRGGRQPVSASHYTLYGPEDSIDYIRVVIDEQRLYAYSRGKLAMTEKVSTASTGINLPLGEDADYPHNHFGVFQIQSKNREAYSQVYRCPMPYALFFYRGHAIHETEQQFYSLLGQPASHGCVREGPEVAKWLFEHTPIGTILEIVQSAAIMPLIEPPSLKVAG